MMTICIIGSNIVGNFIMKMIILALIISLTVFYYKKDDDDELETFYDDDDYYPDNDCLMLLDKIDLQRCLRLQDKHLKKWFYRKTGIKFEKFFDMMVDSNTDKNYKTAKHVLKVIEPYFKRGVMSGKAIPPLDTHKSRQYAIVTLKRMCFLYQIEIYCCCVCYDFSFRTDGGVMNAWGALQSVLNAYGAIYGWSIKDEVDCLTMFHMPLVSWGNEYSRMEEKYWHGYTLHRCRRIDVGDRFGL